MSLHRVREGRKGPTSVQADGVGAQGSREAAEQDERGSAVGSCGPLGPERESTSLLVFEPAPEAPRGRRCVCVCECGSSAAVSHSYLEAWLQLPPSLTHYLPSGGAGGWNSQIDWSSRVPSLSPPGSPRLLLARVLTSSRCFFPLLGPSLCWRWCILGAAPPSASTQRWNPEGGSGCADHDRLHTQHEPT